MLSCADLRVTACYCATSLTTTTLTTATLSTASYSVKAEVDEFMPFVPVVVALRTPGMRPRHWDALSDKLGIDLHPDATYTLTKLIEVCTVLNSISYGAESLVLHVHISACISCIHTSWICS
jgi:Dynein heavy chain, N-terminal region 2